MISSKLKIIFGLSVLLFVAHGNVMVEFKGL